VWGRWEVWEGTDARQQQPCVTRQLHAGVDGMREVRTET
jgi:hypothetical protein